MTDNLEVRARLYAFTDPEPPLRVVVADWARRLRVRWRLGVVAGAITCLVAAGIGLLVPDEYEAAASAIPAGEADGEGLAGLLGTGTALLPRLGFDSAADRLSLFSVVARSRTVLDAVLDTPYGDATIYDVLDDSGRDPALRRPEITATLARDLKPGIDRDAGVFELRYRHADPQFAALLVNRVLEDMDRFFQDRMHADTRNQLATIAERLVDVADSLSAAETRLRDFREQNRTTNRSANLLMQEGRLERAVAIFNSAYMELVVQKERVKVRDAGKGRAVEILDPAIGTVRRTWPPRVRWVLSSVVLVELFLALVVVATGPALPDDRRQDPGHRPPGAVT